MIPKNISQKHILKALEKIKKDGYPKKEKPKDYALLFDNKRYPPKVVIRYANLFANGTLQIDFRGGELNTNKFLRRQGFVIINKNSKPIDDFFNPEEIKYFLKYNGEKYDKKNTAHIVLLKLLNDSLRPKTLFLAKSVLPKWY